MINNEPTHYIDILKLQYDRVAQHENQRLTFSGVILTITSAVFTVLLSLNNSFAGAAFLFLTLFLVIINIFACVFIYKSRGWVKFHQERARFILQHCNPELMKVVYNDKKDKKENCTETGNAVNAPLPPLKKNSNDDLLKRPGLQLYLHATIIIFLICFALYNFKFPFVYELLNKISAI